MSPVLVLSCPFCDWSVVVHAMTVDEAEVKAIFDEGKRDRLRHIASHQDDAAE